MQSSDITKQLQAAATPAPGPLPRVALELRILDSALDAEAPATDRPVPSAGGHDVELAAGTTRAARPAVLVVAPDADLRCYLQEHLAARLGLDVLAVPDLPGARALLAAHTPQLLLLDAAAAVLLRDAPHTPVVLLDDAFPREDLPVGVPRQLLPWPFEVGTLVRTVEAMLG